MLDLPEEVVEPRHLDERLGPEAATAAAPARARPPVIVESVDSADDDEDDAAGERDEVTDPLGYNLEVAAHRPSFRPLSEEIRELERSRISAALAAAGGNQRLAAELLAMPLRTFVFKLRQYGLRRSDGSSL